MLHRLGFEVHFLYNHLSYGRILNQTHLSLIVEDECIIALPHEEVLHLPLRLLKVAYCSIAFHRQRESNTVDLQLPVGCEIKDEIVEEFMGVSAIRVSKVSVSAVSAGKVSEATVSVAATFLSVHPIEKNRDTTDKSIMK